MTAPVCAFDSNKANGLDVREVLPPGLPALAFSTAAGDVPMAWWPLLPTGASFREDWKVAGVWQRQ